MSNVRWHVNTVEIFIAHPWVALVIGAGFAALWVWRHRLLAGITALLWLAYGVYEYLMFLRVLCSGECNIRLDVLAVWPTLLALSSIAVIHSLIPRIGQRGAV